MEKKFSKGKWLISSSCSDSIRIATENYDVVADVYDGWNCADKEIDMDVCVANAKLISAAPELLEACQWALKQFEILNDKGLYPTHLLSVNGGDGLMTIIKAINKATK